MKRLATVAAAATLLTFLTPLPAALAHNGNGVTTVGYRLEGENYATPDSGCDPDGDAEHTLSTGDAAQMPHSGCGVNYGTVTFQYPGSFGSFRADTWSGTGETVTSRLDVIVDGSTAASGSITRAPGSGYATVNFSSATAITAGPHTVRVQFTTTSGPFYTNFKFEGADLSTVVTQVASKNTGSGCSQPPSSSSYDIRDTTIAHWIHYHAGSSPMDIRRVWVWDDTGQTFLDDVRTHNAGIGSWCAEADQAISGAFFQARPGSWHVETSFKSVSAQWVRVAPNLSFTVWPKLTTGGVYKNSPGDTTTFTSADTVRVSTTWNTTSAINHSVRYHWYRPGGVEHTAGASQSLPSGQPSYSVGDSLNLLTSGASSYLGTWTVKTWVDSDTNYLDKGTFTFNVTAAPTGPPNDNFANRITVNSVPYSTSVNTANATLETGEPQPPCVAVGSTVWYRYTPGVSGTLTADTLSSGYDTVLAAYTGTGLTSLTNVACNDDYTGSTSQVSFAVTAGTTYWIQLGGHSSATGSANLNVSLVIPPPPPANDNFAGAATVTGSSVTATTPFATVEPGEPRPCGSTGATVWYDYTAPAPGDLVVATSSASFNTVLGVYTGSAVTALTTIGCNDDYSGTASQVSLVVTAGTTYHVQLGGNNSATGTTTVLFTFTASPGNDLFANATTVNGSPTSVQSTTNAARLEPGEPRPCGNIGATVWYTYTLPAAGDLVVDTITSAGFDTMLAAYTGPSVSSLTNVACWDNSYGNWSQIAMSGASGTTFRIQLGGTNAATGTATVQFTFTPAPGNDNFANAIAVTGSPTTISATTTAATVEPGEPQSCGGTGIRATVWYTYTLPVAGRLVVDTTSASYPSLVAAYTGASVSTLTTVGCTTTSGSPLTANGPAGAVLRIQLGGAGAGTATLRFTFTAAPANDNFANAIAVTGSPTTITATTVAASLEPSEARCGTPLSTVWYTYTLPSDGKLVIDTLAAPSYSTIIAVYTGPSVSWLTLVGCNSSPGFGAQVAVRATAGTVLRIQLGGTNATGPGDFRFTFTPGPLNDDFGYPTTIGATPYTTTQSTSGATFETGAGEQAPCVSASATVWFSYENLSSEPRRMYLDTFGSSFDTTVGVWTGQWLGNLNLVACNDNGPGTTTQSQTSWVASPGTTYRIQIAGVGGATGTLKLRLREATLVAFGDSVVAGHGLGPTPTGYPNDPVDAYPTLVGKNDNLRVMNMAQTGACAGTGTGGACGQSILADQLPNVAGDVATDVVIGVGADDVQFADCITAFMTDKPSDMGLCQPGDTRFETNLARLRSNLLTVLQRAAALSTPAPQIVVVGYYNPFAPAPSLGNYNQVCDMWMPAAIQRDYNAHGALASMPHSDHTTATFRKDVLPVQDSAYTYAVNMLNRLNTVIQGAVAQQAGAQYVLPDFTGHDICTVNRGGTSADTWVYGPDWNDHWDGPWPTQNYHSRPTDTHTDLLCPSPQDPGGDTEQAVHMTGWFGVSWHYDLWFRPNCLPHPTKKGHEALRDLVAPLYTFP